MSNRTLFFIQFLFVVPLFVFHFFYAVPNDWYWHYLWLDLPMHFLGGLWAGLAVTWGLRLLLGRASFLAVLAGIVTVGVTWELYEYMVGFQREANYALDTAIDLCLDSLGGVFGFFAARAGQHDTMIANVEVQNNPS
jgi:hypothetical protein